MEIATNQTKTTSYAVKTYGDLGAWAELTTPHPLGGTIAGKRFLGGDLGLDGMEVSLNSLGPGESIPFVHGHRLNEELYLFLSGRGQMQLDDEVIEVSAGTAVRVTPPVMRCWRNTGSKPLTCIVIQAQSGSLTQATLHDGFISQRGPSWSEGAPKAC